MQFRVFFPKRHEVSKGLVNRQDEEKIPPMRKRLRFLSRESSNHLSHVKWKVQRGISGLGLGASGEL